MSAPSEFDLVAFVRAVVDERLEATLASPAPDPREWFSVAEAAEYLHVSKRTVERWIKRGELRSSLVVEGRRLIRREWLNEFAAAREDVAPATPPRRRGSRVRGASHVLGGQHEAG